MLRDLSHIGIEHDITQASGSERDLSHAGLIWTFQVGVSKFVCEKSYWLDMCLYAGQSSPHKTVLWFVLGSTTIIKMISTSSNVHLTTCYQVFAFEPPTIYVHEPSPIMLVVMGSVKES